MNDKPKTGEQPGAVQEQQEKALDQALLTLQKYGRDLTLKRAWQIVTSLRLRLLLTILASFAGLLLAVYTLGRSMATGATTGPETTTETERSRQGVKTRTSGELPIGISPIELHFDFEADEAGWIPQDYPGNHAIRFVFQSSEHSKTGSHSLAANVYLTGGDENYDEGETYVYVFEKSQGALAPLNLETGQLRAWVFIPANVVMGDRPGGIQLFLKDIHWRSLYGPYISLERRVGFWFILTLAPGGLNLMDLGYVHGEFDRRQVIAIGVKLDARGEAERIYEGNIFIDNVVVMRGVAANPDAQADG